MIRDNLQADPRRDLGDDLRDALCGDVLRPGDDEYAAAAATFFANGRPALVVRPRDAADVAATVRRVRRAGLPLSVRSGGHGLLGTATNDDGVVLDLSGLDAIELLDGTRAPTGGRVVRVGAGARWGQVMRALAPHGLGLTAGDTAGVGVGGLVLGGGIGWLVRRHGLAVDQVVGARVVTADGQVRRADSEEHPDLFWAIRGGGGNFGVVVSLDLVTAPVPPVHFGTLTFRADDPARLVAAWRDHMRTAPESLTSTLALVPETFGGTPAVTVTLCYADDAAGPLRAIGPLRALGELVADDVRVLPYADVLVDAHQPPDLRMLSRNTLVPALDDAAIETALGLYRHGAMTVLRSLGGAFARVPVDATAFAHRDAEAMIHAVAFLPPGAGAAEADAALAPWAAVARLGTGVYLNFQGSDTPADVAAAYPPRTYARLAEAKRAYDPENVFGRGHAIVPAAGERVSS